MSKTVGMPRRFIKVFTVLSLFLFPAAALFAQTATVTQNFVAYPISGTQSAGESFADCQISTTTAERTGNNVSFYTTPIAPVSSSDPWVNSALIEYSQQKTNADGTKLRTYPNNCLSLCADITCSNPVRQVEGSDGDNNTKIYPVKSGDFPIQSILFELFKYQQNANPYNPDSTPPIRTIALYPTGNDNICYGVGIVENTSDPTKATSCCDDITWNRGCQPQCSSSDSVCNSTYCNSSCSGSMVTCSNATNSSTCYSFPHCYWNNATSSCQQYIYSCSQYNSNRTSCRNAGCTWGCDKKDNSPCADYLVKGACAEDTNCYWSEAANTTSKSSCQATAKNFVSKSDCYSGTTRLKFCAAWDGTYEIDGEFGQSNGDFGYRTTISSNWPGDGISTPEIDLSHTIVYPGKDQIPIQVDVTNIHSVRSTPTLVGQKKAVTAEPYNINYRISKDATVTINIIDPTGTNKIERRLVNQLPREGEGFQGGGVGSSEDTITTMSESWDGRDDAGRLLPFGNYLVSLQAWSEDEWDKIGDDAYPSSDVSRIVTRQLSLDPLKITDIEVTGLAKTSTAYAMVNYILTEAATVHFEVYTPGTTFTDTNIKKNTTANATCASGYCSNNSSDGPKMTANSGYKVFSLVEQKAGRTKVNSKWDGMCWSDAATCANAVQTVLQGKYVNNADTGSTEDYAGAAMPDGDYVYVIWAEIPYSGSTKTINGYVWDGVKTARIENGILGINRGMPELTVGSVGYSTIGSSPVAHGLDPFIFSYALSRDAYVTAEVLTTSYDASGNKTVGPYVVKTLLDNEIQTSARAGNKLSWDGIDNNGRYVTQGSYLFRVIARDSLYPTKVVTSTVEFPVDLFRVVDVGSTSLLEEATSQATISYVLSKSMDVTLNIYDRDIVIPNDIREENWPPRVCQSSSEVSADGKAQCIYRKASDGSVVVDPTIEPIKSFTGARQGESRVTEYWDGYYETTEDGSNVSGETQAMYPDGFYPYYIYAKADVAGSKYYTTATLGGSSVLIPQDPKANEESGFISKVDASDHPTGYITIARGPVYFTKIDIKPSSPKLVYSSETIQIPVYEISFMVTRTASVQVQIVSLSDGACTGTNGSGRGAICRVLTKTNTSYLSTVYDGNVENKLYWDGKDEQGKYVKSDAYQVRFIAEPYPKAEGVSQTIESRVLNVDNFQIFDRYTTDVTRDNGSVGTFAYQVSVPMKVAIQIFKPGTMTSGAADGTLIDPADPTGPAIGENSIDKVLVKAIVGVSPHLIPIERVWDGTDYRGQIVPDGIYPFRYVSVLDSYDMNSINGAIRIESDQSEVTSKVADWDKYANLENIMVVNGDSWYADLDWKSDKVTMFYPNPLRQSYGQFEITKMPAPGTISIKIYNIAGDLVRDGGYECMNARGVTSSLEEINNAGGLEPDWTSNVGGSGEIIGGGNFALRCKWDRTNNHGRKVARGLYYAIMELNPTRGNATKSQKVIKILIP